MKYNVSLDNGRGGGGFKSFSFVSRIVAIDKAYICKQVMPAYNFLMSLGLQIETNKIYEYRYSYFSVMVLDF